MPEADSWGEWMEELHLSDGNSGLKKEAAVFCCLNVAVGMEVKQIVFMMLILLCFCLFLMVYGIL